MGEENKRGRLRNNIRGRRASSTIGKLQFKRMKDGKFRGRQNKIKIKTRKGDWRQNREEKE